MAAELPTRSDKLVTVFGGSGFIGRHVVDALARRGYRVRVACRRPDLAYNLQPLGRVGQIMPVQANLRFPASIAAALREADAVVNLVGVLNPSGAQSYEAVHVEGARAVARAAAAVGINRIVHLSAIGADAASDIAYARTKGQAEQAVRQAAPSAIVMRPSVVFGPDDFFFNRFAELTRLLWVLPIVGQHTKMQPVFAGDVGEAVARAVEGAATPGATYELGGPEIVTLRQTVEWIVAEVERRRLIAPLPEPIAAAMAWTTETASKLTFGLFPPVFTTTREELALLKNDNVVSRKAQTDGRTLHDLNITPESFRAIVPSYLWRYRRAGQFDRRPDPQNA